MLTSFKGRIGRGFWWLGFGIVLAAAVIGSLVIDHGVWTREPPRVPSRSLAAWFALLVVPMTAVAVKRFNDRDRPIWPGYAMGALGIVMIIAEQLGFMVDPSCATVLDRAALSLVVAIFVLAFIDNGFLRGTQGANRHGPDPLASSQSGA